MCEEEQTLVVTMQESAEPSEQFAEAALQSLTHLGMIKTTIVAENKDSLQF